MANNVENSVDCVYIFGLMLDVLSLLSLPLIDVLQCLRAIVPGYEEGFC